jgi:hypothetical protein
VNIQILDHKNNKVRTASLRAVPLFYFYVYIQDLEESDNEKVVPPSAIIKPVFYFFLIFNIYP